MTERASYASVCISAHLPEPALPHSAPSPDRYDIAIIGAGVVGCALARSFAMAGARVVVLEKAHDILDGASKGNSAILHTGFDAPTGSLEAACVAAGHAEYLEIRERLGLPLLTSGALVIAWSDEEEAALPGLMEQARSNGVTDIEYLDGPALREAEPGLGAEARAAFRVPREYLIDPWSAPLAYLTQAIAHGADVRRRCEVTGGAFNGTDWTLKTSQGPVRTSSVINAAGLYGDRIDDLLLGRTDFTIKPRKGQFIVYDKPAFDLARHILLPVPTKVTKGIVVCRTIWGNLLVGPTAEEQNSRTDAGLHQPTLEALKARGQEILPALAHHKVTALYAGLRPATEEKHYRISKHPENMITVGGIRSTGLSAALGIAQHVRKLWEDERAPDWIAPEPVWPSVPNIAETAPRDWQSPGHGGVLCHCEMVTEREIRAALNGPLPAQSLAGLKRRTRVTMGRCQGYYCAGALARLTKGKLSQPMTADD
ncbi:NAD(P)/FAD-dependent oxidoreductase [Flavimaricola marinus]|uniref:NAD(P)/FAD-dependent oxidoreductase n=1 Tax=Flavimaricola marinus TaxID=1819565 RepID=UPI001FE2611A|nr:NAD(P)/FAD-dependent oxidoreductase [Flavimaricola marinus]